MKMIISLLGFLLLLNYTAAQTKIQDFADKNFLFTTRGCRPDLDSIEVLRCVGEDSNIKTFPDVRTLRLFGNIKQYDYIISHLDKCENLESLVFCIDKDTNLNLIFKKIRKLKNLKQLCIIGLKDNKLNTIPKEIGSLTQIEHLTLTHHNIKKLPKEIRKLKNLLTVDLSFNQNLNSKQALHILSTHKHRLITIGMEAVGLKEFPKQIATFKKLQRISLRANHIHQYPCSIKYITVIEVSDTCPFDAKEIRLPECLKPKY